jgi:uncharacterized protein
MSIFVDTSGLYAVLDADDSNHQRAQEQWINLLGSGEQLVSTNYVLVETTALVQRRLGLDAVRSLHQGIVPVLTINWVDAVQHAGAMGNLLASANRQVSLVDWISFDPMRRLTIRTAFALDQDFRTQGFETVPSNNDSP